MFSNLSSNKLSLQENCHTTFHVCGNKILLDPTTSSCVQKKMFDYS